MNNKSAVIFLFLLILSACCPMVSVNPLDNSENAEYDKRIEGTWKLISEQDEYVYLHIGRLSGNEMVALSVEHKKNGELDTMKFPFFLTRSGKNNYLNIRVEDISDEISKKINGFIFLKYEFAEKNKLLVFNLAHDPVISAIQENKLKGVITYKKQLIPEGTKIDNTASEKKIDCVKITDTSKNIRKFFESGNHKELFPEAMKFVRIN